jgi:PKD repeat protein
MRYLFTILLLILGHTVTHAVTANFTVDFNSGCTPLVVHFTNTSTGATSYSWDLGNGTLTPSTNPSPVTFRWVHIP